MIRLNDRLCEEVLVSDASAEDKLRAIRRELGLIERGVYSGVVKGELRRFNADRGHFNMDSLAGTVAQELIGEIDYVLRKYPGDPRLNRLVNRYNDYLFMLSQRAYEGRIIMDVLDKNEIQ